MLFVGIQQDGATQKKNIIFPQEKHMLMAVYFS